MFHYVLPASCVIKIGNIARQFRRLGDRRTFCDDKKIEHIDVRGNTDSECYELCYVCSAVRLKMFRCITHRPA